MAIELGDYNKDIVIVTKTNLWQCVWISLYGFSPPLHRVGLAVRHKPGDDNDYAAYKHMVMTVMTMMITMMMM